MPREPLRAGELGLLAFGVAVTLAWVVWLVWVVHYLVTGRM